MSRSTQAHSLRYRSPDQSSGFWLHHAALAWRAALEDRLRPLDLTHTQFFLLGSAGWLAATECPPTQRQVVEHAGADVMMASKVLRTLERRGLLSRQADPTDGRARRIVLTTDGETVVRQACRSWPRWTPPSSVPKTVPAFGTSCGTSLTHDLRSAPAKNARTRKPYPESTEGHRPIACVALERQERVGVAAGGSEASAGQ